MASVSASLGGYGAVVTDLRQACDQAISARAGEDDGQRERAWRDFINAPRPNDAELDDTNSKLQSSDVNSAITAVTAQMVISFGQDSVVTFEANSAEDEAQAAAESRAVNKAAIEDNGGYRVILGGIQNALLYRVGYLKTWWDEDINRYMVSHKNIERVDLPILVEQQPIADGVAVERRLVSYDEDKKTARVEITEKRNRLKCAPIANDLFFHTPGWDRESLEGVPLCGEVHYKTRNDLVRMGVEWEIVKDLPAVTRNSGVESSNTRRVSAAQAVPIVSQMDIVRVFEAYAWLSFEENEGRAYLYKCWVHPNCDEWLLDPLPVSRIPYSSGSAFPIANRHEGESLADKMAEIQSGKTEFLRQWADNIRNCSYGRYTALSGQVNMEDVLTPKAGGPIRVRSQGAVQPIPVLDVGPSIAAGMDRLDQMRTERGGSALDMAGAEMQIAGDSAHGTERLMASRELQTSYMTRNLAESLVRGLFLKAHAELRDGDGGPITIKIAEQYMPVDPTQWPARNHCNVESGYSIGERMQKLGVLGGMIDKYVAGLQMAGGEMFTLAGLYKLVNDYMRLALIDNPESYFIDPNSEQAKKAGQDKQAQAAQQAAMANEAAQHLVMIPEQIKAISSQQKTDAETQFKYFDAVLTAIASTAEGERQSVIDFATARDQAKALSADARGMDGAGGGATSKPGAPGGKGKKPGAAAK
jgi:hypothetical protein